MQSLKLEMQPVDIYRITLEQNKTTKNTLLRDTAPTNSGKLPKPNFSGIMVPLIRRVTNIHIQITYLYLVAQ